MRRAAAASFFRAEGGLAWAGVVAMLLQAGAVWSAWFHRSATPSGELAVEVLPEEILSIEPPDWEALAAEIEAQQQAGAVGEEIPDAATEGEGSPAEEAPVP